MFRSITRRSASPRRTRRSRMSRESERPAESKISRLQPVELVDMKARGSKIAMVTAYDAPSARLADAAGVDALLVGDSAAMTVLGLDSTVPVTVDEMLMLTRAVARGARRALIV